MSAENPQFRQSRIKQVKPDGRIKYRDLVIPVDDAMQEHRDMLKLLYECGSNMPHATAAIPGKQLLDNVKPHRNNRYFYMLDLKDAFPSVDVPTLLSNIKKPLVPRHHQAEVKRFIAQVATTPLAPGLPLGAPASPYLFNLYCAPLDKVLGNVCRDAGFTYTRYLDDLTFSSLGKIGAKSRRKLNGIIQSYPGMQINHPKSRVHSLDRGAVTITGVSVYPNGRLGASPRLLEMAREVFREVHSMAEAGIEPLPEDIGRLHGYHGAVHQLTDGETPTTRELDREYLAALGRLGAAYDPR